MRAAMNRALHGARLQGIRHGQLRQIIPVKRPNRPSQAVYAGNPEYPVEDIYAERRSKGKE